MLQRTCQKVTQEYSGMKTYCCLQVNHFHWNTETQLQYLDNSNQNICGEESDTDKENREAHSLSSLKADSHIACRAHAVPLPCRGLEKNGMVRSWRGRGMARVNQTRPHCVNQIGMTHSKPLATRHGRGKAWARYGHGMLCVNRPFTWQPHHNRSYRSWKPDRLQTFPPFKQTQIYSLSVGRYHAVNGKKCHSFLGS